VATRADLPEWVLEALEELGGSAHAVEVAKVVWRRHEPELRASGDLFYTWQYDLRWAGTTLRKQGFLSENSRGEKWSLAGVAQARVSSDITTEADLELEIGAEYERSELNAKYGGQVQGGIVTPKRFPFILVFSSPAGRDFGYHDHWESPDTFRYFGHGQYGEMKFERGNKAIRDSGVSGKALLLFVRETKGVSTFRFEGVFRYDDFDWIEANEDGSNQARRAICFRLVRVLG
jgi:hypothetical protein